MNKDAEGRCKVGTSESNWKSGFQAVLILPNSRRQPFRKFWMVRFLASTGRGPPADGLAQPFQQASEMRLAMLQSSHAIAQLFDVVSQPRFQLPYVVS